MEIINDVIKIKKFQPKILLDLFLKLNLNNFNQTCSNFNDYLKYVYDEQNNIIIKKILNLLFESNNHDLYEYFLYAFFINFNQKKIFFYFTISYEDRLIKYSSYIVSLITKLNLISSESILKNFVNSFEHYCSLFCLWKMKKKIKDFKEIIQNIDELAETCKLFMTLDSNNSIIDEFQNKLFNTIKSGESNLYGYLYNYVFKNYDYILVSKSIKDKFWNMIFLNNDSKKTNHILIIGLSIIKDKILKSLLKSKNLKLKKDIYDNIDIDNLVHFNRNNFDNDLINSKINNKINFLYDIFFKNYNPDNKLRFIYDNYNL